MNFKILIVFLLGIDMSLLQSAQPSSPGPFSGIDPVVAAQIARFADEVNQAGTALQEALQRAVAAEKRATEAEGIVSQVVHERDKLAEQQVKLFGEAAELEDQLKKFEQLIQKQAILLDHEAKKRKDAEEQLVLLNTAIESTKNELETATTLQNQLQRNCQKLKEQAKESEDQIAKLTDELSKLQQKPCVVPYFGDPSLRKEKLGKGNVFQDMQKEQERVEKAKEVQKELERLKSEKSETIREFEYVVEQLTVKDIQIRKLEEQLEKSKQDARELQDFKYLETEHGFTYVLPGDVPASESAELEHMFRTTCKLPDPSLQARLIVALNQFKDTILPR